MGRKPTKYLETRRKLEWFFENTTVLELRSLSIDVELSETNFIDRQWKKTGSRLEISRIKTVLTYLVSPEGIENQGRILRLTERMAKHVIAEFTSKGKAVEILYGPCPDRKKRRSNGICYTQILNKALARIDAAFFFVGIHGGTRRAAMEGDYDRNPFGYLTSRKKT